MKLYLKGSVSTPEKTLSSSGCFWSCCSTTAKETLSQCTWGRGAPEGTRQSGQGLSRKAPPDGRVLCSD